MGLKVTFVSGPRRAGKSTVIQTMLGELYDKPPHYLRLAAIDGDKHKPTKEPRPSNNCGVRTAHWLNYDENLIYEVLPNTLTAIHKKDRYGKVLIEADADPHLRNAYPYDHRVFVMRAPESLHDVFRTPYQAAEALRHVLDDTTAFAREIYGMLDGELSDELDREHEDRPMFSPRQMRGFLNSPLGDELATRIQFQPDYHGLVESDIVLINTGLGAVSEAAKDCVWRIQRLLSRLSSHSGLRGEVFLCDPLAQECPARRELLERVDLRCCCAEP